MKYFYSHIVEVESLLVELDKMDLSKPEKHHLALLIDANIQTHMLDLVFSELSNKDKQIFLHYFSSGEHEKARKHLLEKIENLDEKISKAADEIKNILHKDVKESRRIGQTS